MTKKPARTTFQFTQHDHAGYCTVSIVVDGREHMYLDETGQPSRFMYREFAARGVPSQSDFQALANRIGQVEAAA